MNQFFTKLFLLLHNLGIFIINNEYYDNFMLHGLDDLAAKWQKSITRF